MSVLDNAWEQLPQYARDYGLGLLAASLSDPIVTSLAIGVLATNPRVRKFFLSYAATRTINSVANAIGTGGLALAHAVRVASSNAD